MTTYHVDGLSEPIGPDTRNVVPPENAGTPGGYTFNASPPVDYQGIVWVLAVLRLGDHAHIYVGTGRQHVQRIAGTVERATLGYGGAGHLTVRWPEWLLLRETLDAVPYVRIAEVEDPSAAQFEATARGMGQESIAKELTYPRMRKGDRVRLSNFPAHDGDYVVDGVEEDGTVELRRPT